MYNLKVTNFQSISDIELQIHGLTVVTAPSHSGKSALVRAVDALLTSNWFQDAYQRKGTSQTIVTLSSASGEQLVFNRKGASTTYTINGVSFGKLNGKVPPELNLAGYGEVQIAESASEVTTILPQIQNQFDGPYQDLIKPAALTQLLGSFTNLAPYQTAQDKAKKQQAESRRDSERVEKDIGSLSTVVATFDAFDPTPDQDQLDRLYSIILYTDASITNTQEMRAYLSVVALLNIIKGLPQPWTQTQLKLSEKFVSGLSGAAIKISDQNKVFVSLKGVKGIKITLQKSLPSNFLISNTLLKQFNASLEPLVKYKGTLKFYREVTAIGQTIQRPVRSVQTTELLTSFGTFQTTTSRFVTQVQKKSALVDLKKCLEIKPTIDLTRGITTIGSRFLNQHQTVSELLAQLESLAAAKEDILSNLHTLEHNRLVIDQALQNNQCPLCLGKLNLDTKKKPSKKKISEVFP